MQRKIVSHWTKEHWKALLTLHKAARDERAEAIANCPIGRKLIVNMSGVHTKATLKKVSRVEIGVRFTVSVDGKESIVTERQVVDWVV
jgi:hypothetical protein